MEPLLLAVMVLFLVFVASLISVETALAVAIIEIAAGVFSGNVLGIHGAPWPDFLAQFGGILLTFLAGTEVDQSLFKAKLKESTLIGGVSFRFPFLTASAFTFFVAHWTRDASLIAGLVLGPMFQRHTELRNKLRVVSFAMITPFFFLKGGMNVSLAALQPQLGLLAALFVVKLVAKTAGVLPLARRHLPGAAMYTTLLMSTGLTFGTISAAYGLQYGYISQTQFSVLVAVVIASAVVPTVIAQRCFAPRLTPDQQEEVLAGAEESV